MVGCTVRQIALRFFFFCIFNYLEILKGQRFAMPLSRIALESPAGAARGQVGTYHFVKKILQLIHSLCQIL